MNHPKSMCRAANMGVCCTQHVANDPKDARETSHTLRLPRAQDARRGVWGLPSPYERCIGRRRLWLESKAKGRELLDILVAGTRREAACSLPWCVTICPRSGSSGQSLWTRWDKSCSCRRTTPFSKTILRFSFDFVQVYWQNNNRGAISADPGLINKRQPRNARVVGL